MKVAEFWVSPPPSIEDFSAEEQVMELVEIFWKVHSIPRAPSFGFFANDNQMILKDVHSSDQLKKNKIQVITMRLTNMIDCVQPKRI